MFPPSMFNICALLPVQRIFENLEVEQGWSWHSNSTWHVSSQMTNQCKAPHCANSCYTSCLDQWGVITYKKLFALWLYTHLSSVNNCNVSRNLLLRKVLIIPPPPPVKPTQLWPHSSGPALTGRSHLVEPAEQLGLRNIDMDDFMNTSEQSSVKYSRFHRRLICLNRSWSPPGCSESICCGGRFHLGGKSTNHHNIHSH